MVYGEDMCIDLERSRFQKVGPTMDSLLSVFFPLDMTVSSIHFKTI